MGIENSESEGAEDLKTGSHEVRIEVPLPKVTKKTVRGMGVVIVDMCIPPQSDGPVDITDTLAAVRRATQNKMKKKSHSSHAARGRRNS